MDLRPGIFPTFFLFGFECSTFLWKDKGRRSLVDETRHRQHADDDYHFLSTLGIAVAREGIPWPLVDKGQGRFDFSPIDPFIAAMREHKILPIWDLCHYGYPDDDDPFSEDFPDRFAEYARAAAAYVIERHRGPYFFTPVNEITFFGYMAAEWGWCAPFGESLACRVDFTTAIARADVAAARAIRDLCPQARFVHVDPLIHVVAPPDRPDLVQAAHEEETDVAFLAFDIIAGRKAPEFGGAPGLLDIVGLNNYSFGQMEYRQGRPNVPLDPGDPRILPVADLIQRAWERYRRPTIIAETSGLKGGRADWLNDILCESMVAVQRGVDLHAVCLFPAVDMPDWHTGEWLNNGIADLTPTPDGDLKRVPYRPYVEMLRHWQHRLKRVTELDEDPFDQPVNLEDVTRAASEMEFSSDANWS